jgi:hypothetical protein
VRKKLSSTLTELAIFRFTEICALFSAFCRKRSSCNGRGFFLEVEGGPRWTVGTTRTRRLGFRADAPEINRHTEAETLHLVHAESHGIIHVLLRGSRIEAKMVRKQSIGAASHRIDPRKVRSESQRDRFRCGILETQIN